MEWVILTKKVDGLPYKVGDKVPVYQGNFGLIWHVWTTIIDLPEDSYTLI
jgi:hypothetical protein